MKVAIHQPNYLPWIGFFDKMDTVDTFVLLDTATYSKSEFINRNKVLTREGPRWLTVPITGVRGPINELIIDNSQNWRKQHWEMIKNAYKKSAFWNDYYEGFYRIYSKRWFRHIDLNITLMNHINNLLGIHPIIKRESEFNIDFGSGNMRNINIVKHLQGHTYISGTGAKAYNDESKFKHHNIQLIYQAFEHPVYRQTRTDFVSHLSIIDMLFHCGPETTNLMRKGRNID